MISVIISFRFSGIFAQRQESIIKTMSFWSMVRDIYNLELVFINDHSDDMELNYDFIHHFPGSKIPWNQPAARNLGAQIAKGDKLLFTDIDHLIYGDFDALNRLSLSQQYVVFPRRTLQNRLAISIHPHLNTFMMNASEFIGFDTDFCGNYGFDDKEFFHRLKQSHQKILSDDTVFSFMSNLRSADIERDKSINALLYQQKTGTTLT